MTVDRHSVKGKHQSNNILRFIKEDRCAEEGGRVIVLDAVTDRVDQKRRMDAQ